MCVRARAPQVVVVASDGAALPRQALPVWPVGTVVVTRGLSPLKRNGRLGYLLEWLPGGSKYRAQFVGRARVLVLSLVIAIARMSLSLCYCA